VTVEPKNNTRQSITLSTNQQARTEAGVFEGNIYNIVWYTCITCSLSHHAMERSRSVKKYSMQDTSNWD